MLEAIPPFAFMAEITKICLEASRGKAQELVRTWSEIITKKQQTLRASSSFSFATRILSVDASIFFLRCSSASQMHKSRQNCTHQREKNREAAKAQNRKHMGGKTIAPPAVSTHDTHSPAFFGPAVSFISIDRLASSRSTSRILE